ncbi:50S ribosomal protein L11 methyltransferase [Candidatus Uhrbacteria bacterium]|nr:50S ribosomal protein L11 methyltransferase [Candidatus Uhrbacteria bacterium]
MNTPLFILLLIASLAVTAIPFSIYWIGYLFIPIIAGGGPYVPSKMKDVNDMIRLARIKPTDTVVDLGSGDGRIVIAAALAGAQKSIGYEIYPGLVKRSQKRISQMRLEDCAEVKCQSMWDADLNNITVVFLFQIPYALDRIRHLLESQLTHGARVISNDFKIPGWEPDLSDGNVHLYTIKDA